MNKHANPNLFDKQSVLSKAGRILLTTLPLLYASHAMADAIGLPEDDLFMQLIADPKTPRTFLSFF